MNNLKLEELTACEIGRLVNKKKLTAVEVIKYFLDRIEARNKSINAFVYVKKDYALEQARIIDKKIARGENCGPFAGVPFALKDFLQDKKGWTSSHGGVKCLIVEDKYNSVFCSAMEKAGGIAIGKTNAPAYGFRGTTDNKMYGPTSTPFNTEYNSGGSSGGSAAAVADGLVPVAEGGDAGGSIRIPANFCNLFGFKAGIGTIPSVCRPDAWSATHPLCFNGGLVKSVEDAAVLLNYMKNEDKRDPYSLPVKTDFAKAIRKRGKKLRIAFTEDFGIFEIDRDVRNTVRKAAENFFKAGCFVEEVKFHFNHTAYEFAQLWDKGITVDCSIELNKLKKNGIDLIAQNREDFPEEFIYWKEVVDGLGIEDLYEFNLARTDVLDQFENVFEKYDLILSPVCCVSSIRNADNKNTKGPEQINGRPVEPLIGWTQTFLANFTGNPACSIPVGLNDENVPAGVQLIGKRYQDETVLKAAKLYEDNFPWRENYKIALERKI